MCTGDLGAPRSHEICRPPVRTSRSAPRAHVLTYVRGGPAGPPVLAFLRGRETAPVHIVYEWPPRTYLIICARGPCRPTITWILSSPRPHISIFPPSSCLTYVRGGPVVPPSSRFYGGGGAKRAFLGIGTGAQESASTCTVFHAWIKDVGPEACALLPPENTRLHHQEGRHPSYTPCTRKPKWHALLPGGCGAVNARLTRGARSSPGGVGCAPKGAAPLGAVDLCALGRCAVGRGGIDASLDAAPSGAAPSGAAAGVCRGGAAPLGAVDLCALGRCALGRGGIGASLDAAPSGAAPSGAAARAC
eukprot:gene5255-biopygen8704